MTPNEKDYMDRYIYQVIRRLPKAQRNEVRMELEELSSDMYADKGSVEGALTQLGDVGMSAAVGLVQSVVGFVLILVTNLVVRKIDPESALF